MPQTLSDSANPVKSDERSRGEARVWVSREDSGNRLVDRRECFPCPGTIVMFSTYGDDGPHRQQVTPYLPSFYSGDDAEAARIAEAVADLAPTLVAMLERAVSEARKGPPPVEANDPLARR